MGTAVCIELLDAEELDGVGEDGHEGVKCCSCKDASDEARRYEHRLGQSIAASMTRAHTYLSALRRQPGLVPKELPRIRPFSERRENARVTRTRAGRNAGLGVHRCEGADRARVERSKKGSAREQCIHLI